MRLDPDHRLRAALPQLRPYVPSAAAHAHHRADCRPAAHHHRVRPTSNYGRPIHRALARQQSHHFRGKDFALRLTTDAPISYIDREAPFVLTKPIHMVLGPDEPLSRRPCHDVPRIRRSHARLLDDWVRRLSIAYDWQDAIIRAAIALKLSNFEETGGIVAALTTSIPEAPGSGRTWDYRYCWLRDAYFVVKALNRFGATQDDGGFHLLHSRHRLGTVDTSGLQRRAVRCDGRDHRRELEGISQRRPGPHRQRRRDANAARHVSAASFSPRCRCSSTGGCRDRATKGLFDLLETLGAQGCDARLRRPTPASGNIAAAPTFTPIRPRCAGPGAAGWRRSRRISVSPIGPLIGRRSRTASNAGLLEEAWSDKRGAFTAAFGDDDLDASVLLLPETRPDRAERSSLRAARSRRSSRSSLRGHHMMRYTSADDFGMPESAFLICRFWLIDAWWWLGRREEARDLFVDALGHRNRYGLLSEDIHPQTGRAVGKFPANLFDGGIDPDGHAPVSKLGGSVLARLILVSNRVPVPAGEGQRPRRRARGRLALGLQAPSRRVVRMERQGRSKCGCSNGDDRESADRPMC